MVANNHYTMHAPLCSELPVIMGNLNPTHIDIDECSEGIDGCAQTCTDTDGRYTCSCISGYQLASDGHGCDG